MTKLITGLAALLPMTMLACASVEGSSSADPADSDSSVAEDLTLGASFKSTSGDQVDVYQDGDGGLVVSLMGPAMSNPTIAAYQKGEADLIDLYVGLAGNSEVPADVAAMNEIFLERREQRASPATNVADASQDGAGGAASAPVEDANQAERTSGPPRTAQDLTPSYLPTQKFVYYYCTADDYWDYRMCWPDSSGTRDYGQWCASLHTYAYAITGAITHRIDRYHLGKWRTQLSNSVPTGYLSSLSRFANGSQDNMRGGVWDAAGDSYHLSIFGRRW